MADLVSLLRDGEVDDGIIDSIGQLYLASLPDLSWAKHGMHRKGTPGFSQDARRAFAQNLFRGARHLAKLRYADRLADQLLEAGEHIRAMREVYGFDNIKAVQVLDEMTMWHDLLMKPPTSAASTALTSVGFLYTR
jgi:hypothetical protein